MTSETSSTSIGAVKVVRMPWIDGARGAAMALVVLMHFVFWVNIPSAADEPIVRVWQFITGSLSPFRMSLLYVLSGLLTSVHVLRGWESPKVRSRVLDGIYLFVLWTAIYAGFSLLPLAGMGIPYRHDSILIEFVAPTTPLWFIAGLALWTLIVSWLAPRVNKWAVLATLGALTVVIGTVWQGVVPMRMFYYGFFFAVGVYGAAWLKQYGSAPGRWPAAIGAALIVGVMGGQLLMPIFDPLARAIAGLAGVPVAVFTVSVLCRYASARRLLSWLGKRTLTIYVLHLPLLILISALVDSAHIGRAPIVMLAAPLIGMVGVLILCGGAHDVIANSRLSFLVRRPQFALGAKVAG